MGRTVTDKTRFSPTKSAEARNRNENSSNCERMQQLQRSQMLSKEKQKILMNKLRKAHAAEWKVTDPYADNEECIQFFETEVAIIGNGPAGIALSAMLSGLRPFYVRAHPDPEIHSQFAQQQDQQYESSSSAMAGREGTSLIDMDLEWFRDGLAERINPAIGAFACLYDTLERPPWHSNSSHSPTPEIEQQGSCLEWCQTEEAKEHVQHIVFGDGQIGGSWCHFDEKMLTLSVQNWMDLPGLTVDQWLRMRPSYRNDVGNDFMGNSERITAHCYKNYLLSYTEQMGLREHFRQFTQITEIFRCNCSAGQPNNPQHDGFESADKQNNAGKSQCWLLTGVDFQNGQRKFWLHCRAVVFATGAGAPRRLGVAGEEFDDDMGQTCDGPPRIVHGGLPALKRVLLPFKQSDNYGERMTNFTDEKSMELDDDEDEQMAPVVIIGAGISAAEAIIYCLDIGRPVLHVIRRGEAQLDNTMLARVANGAYPEYRRVYELMTGRRVEPAYQRRISCQVLAIDTARRRIFLASSNKGKFEEHFHCVVVCVGSNPESPLVKHLGITHNAFAWNYQSFAEPTIFRIGAAAGDRFIRYIPGGAFQVAQTLIKRWRHAIKTSAAHCSSLQISSEDEVDERSDEVNVNHGSTNAAKTVQPQPQQDLTCCVGRLTSNICYRLRRFDRLCQLKRRSRSAGRHEKANNCLLAVEEARA